MSAAAGAERVPAVGPGPAAARASAPAQSALRRVVVRFAVFLRVTCAVAGGAAALAALGPPVRPAVVAAATAVLLAWSALFAWRALRGGLATWLVLTDLTLTVAVCLLLRHLVPAAVLPGEVSWVAILASTSVVLAQLAWPAVASVPAGLVVAAGYLAGASAAGDRREAVAHATTLVVQTLSTAILMLLVRRAGRGADGALAGFHQSLRGAAVDRARRAEERRLNRDLHDTVLSTLTMVGLGAVTSGSGRLRERAAADLAVLDRLSGEGGGASDADGCRLDERLAVVPSRVPELSVHLRLTACRVPGVVAAAVTDSTAEALANVARHAGTGAADVSLRCHDGGVRVDIVDTGAGFDPGTVPAHRYGVRESISARMAAAGGWAEITSTPGRGTRVRLEWPHER